MATAADTVAFALGLKNEVKGTGVFGNVVNLKREGAEGADSEYASTVSTVIFVIGAAGLFSFVNALDMASKGIS